jgi:osmoprotectant transport system ATP-binding protein
MIAIEGLTKVYDSVAAVDDVSMVVEAGALTVIVGASGSGKSTLMRMVNRVVEPTSGRVLIDGEDTAGLPVHELRRRIGYAIQNHGLFPHRNVAQNIATVPTLLGWDRRRIAARVEELLCLFQLDPATFARRFPHELSGGQQQRVGVARALAAEPKLLLMDEPFSALDPLVRAKAQDDLKAIQRQLSTTIILVTHDMEEAIRLGDRIAVMDSGKLLQYAPPAEILVHPATPFVGALIGVGDRPFRLLSLETAAQEVEPGEAEGAIVAADADLRDVLAELLWSRRVAAPVAERDGRVIGRVTLARLIERAGTPT